MPRRKKDDLGEIVSRAQRLRADIDALASDMREITQRLVLSVLTKEAKKRARPSKAKRRGRPSETMKRGRPPKAKG